jgi:muconate cycloisomerase
MALDVDGLGHRIEERVIHFSKPNKLCHLAMNAQIISVEAILVDLPTIRAHQLAMATMQQQTLVIVRLRSSDGIEGLGEATTIGGLAYGEESPEGIKLTIDTYLAPALTGLDATNINGAMLKLNKVARGNRFAKCAIETALLDAQGKRLGVPVSTLLGGAVRKTLPVLWTLASGDTQRDIEEAEMLLAERRHNTFKLKIGRRGVREDVAHVSKIKAALGDRAKVTVDVNQAWSELDAALGIEALEAAGVDLIEQPTPREQRGALARLASCFIVPIMADEAVTGPEDALELVRGACADVFALKIAKSGGIYAMLRTAAIADAAGVSLYGGTMLEGSVGSIASAHGFSALPQLNWGTELFGPLLLKDDIVTARPQYRDFDLHLPEGPGLGLHIDEEKLAFYRRDKNI